MGLVKGLGVFEIGFDFGDVDFRLKDSSDLVFKERYKTMVRNKGLDVLGILQQKNHYFKHKV